MTFGLLRKVLPALLLSAFSVTSVYPAFAQSCSVTISKPLNGENVGARSEVEGTARIPDDAYLWLLAKRRSFVGAWWPQGLSNTPIDDSGNFVGLVHFGTSDEDLQKLFIVKAIVVDRQQHQSLTAWAATAQERGYPPIALPNILDSCPSPEVSVQRIATSDL